MLMFSLLQCQCPLPRLGGRTPPSESENGLHETVGEMRVNKQHLKAPRKQQASGAFSPHKVQSLSSRLGVPSFNHKNAQSRTMTGPLMARHQDPLLANQVQDEMVSSSIMLDIAAHLGAMDTRLNREEVRGSPESVSATDTRVGSVTSALSTPASIIAISALQSQNGSRRFPQTNYVTSLGSLPPW